MAADVAPLKAEFSVCESAPFQKEKAPKAEPDEGGVSAFITPFQIPRLIAQLVARAERVAAVARGGHEAEAFGSGLSLDLYVLQEF